MPTPMTVARLMDRFQYFESKEQQQDAVAMLHDAIGRIEQQQGQAEILLEEAPWSLRFSEPDPKPPATEHSNPLVVPYFSQNDNASGTGYRECFSSSCAMLAAFWGKVSSDDAYNVIRAQYGDSTEAQAQLSALRSLGLEANFFTNGVTADLNKEIDAGRPVATGWLHKGPSSSPSGSGHWTVVIGYEAGGWIHNDPNGEANLVGGGYTSNLNGKGQHYSCKNWDPRWRPGGSGGWFLVCKG
ncbi:C39 family peptidase [Synechococcus sp. CS-602]|uniref:C39 family peptidase n=1 Tax=Synechococcus sp. CS-602 TaxID=2847982 RepID=UPI00223BA34B|nr:C39 family peptidase [Synechococcus sp. CS-602]MCT0203800.1 C39 family peptidase [Synechococcus sp. CS-602]